MYGHVLTGVQLSKAIEQIKCMRKYAFLYATTPSTTTTTTITPTKTNTFACYVIHKIEIYPSYTYPTVSTNETTLPTTTVSEAVTATTRTTASNNINNTIFNYNSNIMPPYRTLSHYGFNCPLAFLPSISLYPKNLINTMNDEFTQYLQLQRHLVIEFLKSAAHNLNSNKTTMQNITELDKKEEQVEEVEQVAKQIVVEAEEEEEGVGETNYTTVKELQLMTPTNQKGRQRYWTRTTSTCSSTTPTTATTSSTAEEVETSGLYSYTSTTYSQEHEDADADCSAGSCTSLHNKNDTDNNNNKNSNNKYLHSYILRKSASSRQSKAIHSLAELEFVRRPKLTETKTESLEEQLKEIKIDEATSTYKSTNVKAKVNATQQTLEILISVHMNRDTQWSEVYFKQLTATIDAEMQTIAQELQTNNESSLIANTKQQQRAKSNLTSSIVKNQKPSFEHNLSLLENELEKLLNGILHANILAQNIRSACTENK